MKNVQKIDLGLTGYDELFANDEERKVNKLPRIFDLPISEAGYGVCFVEGDDVARCKEEIGKLFRRSTKAEMYE